MWNSIWLAFLIIPILVENFFQNVISTKRLFGSVAPFFSSFDSNKFVKGLQKHDGEMREEEDKTYLHVYGNRNNVCFRYDKICKANEYEKVQ